ncbi:hypothetical protein EC957_000657 [Mortierella hygrophila]|uniref:Uncharacterized protein n=1 Tax=Mortierella hygrophila TaxID=979708 RepID=A0A9P6FHJ8_9FUNG|nr:hypothetical protein EC957_000657 [Mortierella hygrophila]
MDASHVFAAQILDTLPEPEIAEIQHRQAHITIKSKLNLPNMDDEDNDQEDEVNNDERGAQVSTAEEQANASLPS